MALSRMNKISNLCSKELLKFQHEPKLQKTIRSFRKTRATSEETKINPESLATPFTHSAVDTKSLRLGNLTKPFLFTIGFSGATFIGATIWEYETMRSHALSKLKQPIKFFKRKIDEGLHQTNAITKEIKKWWYSLTPGERIFVPICGLNILVFLAWRVPGFQPFMLKYFCSNPASSKVCLPMILSTFSHYSGLHLLANMYVLHSFSTGAVQSLGKEQFLALYLTSGAVSSFTSYFYKIITKQPGLSLGASGAIMGVLGYICTQYPETKLGIILIPLFTFSAGAAIKFIIGLDSLGALLGWKFFDHAAHLGGAACGISWAVWGNQYLWQKREPILQYWHEFRGSIK